ncbi:Membrane transport domain containing protein [Tylopilus felleus]
MGVPIQHILFTVFQSIFQVFLLCLAGFTLSYKGIVDKSTSKVLNHINIALFTPALLFSKVAYFLSPAKLRQLWVIPIFFVVLSGISALIAHWLARACRLKRTQVNFATAASMFMNSNSLPVALMQSLVTTVPLLKWGQNDTIDAMFGRSLTYLVVFSTLGMILRWSYGIRLLSQANEPETPPPTTYHDVNDSAQQPTLTHITIDPSTAAPLVDYETEVDIGPRDKHVRPTRTHRTRVPHPRLTPLARRYSHPHTHSHSRLPTVPTCLGDHSETEDTDELETTEGDSEDTIALPGRPEPTDTGFSTEAEDHVPAPAPAPPPSLTPSAPTPRWDRPARPSVFKRFVTTITSLSPPLIASLFALFCVLVPPVQRLLKSNEMIPFKGALDSAGGCSVPLTLLVLGGWFWDGESKHKASEPKPGSHGKANAKSKGKAVEKRHATVHVPRHVAVTDSRDSSTTSLSSMIGAFGDVLMGRIHPRRGAPQTKRRVTRGAAADDVEPGLLTTHAEAEGERAEGGVARRSRSQTGGVNGRARPSPLLPSSASAPASSPVSAPVGTPSLPGETLTVVVTLLARMVIVPAIVTPLMVLISKLGWGGEVFEDPVFLVSSMLLIASPPALTLAQISQRVKAAPTTTTGAPPTTSAPATPDADAFSPFERLLSRTVFWAYLVLTPPITIASVMVGLLMIGA